MAVTVEGVGDLETLRSRSGEVAPHVALRIEDQSLAGLFIAYEIGRVSEALQIELAEEHRASLNSAGVDHSAVCKVTVQDASPRFSRYFWW